MSYLRKLSSYVFILVFILCCVKYGECGECCKAYTGIWGTKFEEKWCDHYCCVKIGKLYCCNYAKYQAPASHREGFCKDWFSSHIWAPIVGTIVFVLIIASCCVGCYRLCSDRSSDRSTVLLQCGQRGYVTFTTTSS